MILCITCIAGDITVVSNLSTSLAVVLTSIGALGIDNDQKKYSHKAIILIICVFGAYVYWSYSAVLVSYLTVVDNELPINNLEDVVAKNGYFIILRNGSITNDYFEEAQQDTNPVAYQIHQSQFNHRGNS